jgi:hypothetical protein
MVSGEVVIVLLELGETGTSVCTLT